MQTTSHVEKITKLKIILLDTLLNVLWVACWNYESPPSLARKSALIRVMVYLWQPSRSRSIL